MKLNNKISMPSGAKFEYIKRRLAATILDKNIQYFFRGTSSIEIDSPGPK